MTLRSPVPAPPAKNVRCGSNLRWTGWNTSTNCRCLGDIAHSENGVVQGLDTEKEAKWTVWGQSSSPIWTLANPRQQRLDLSRYLLLQVSSPCSLSISSVQFIVFIDHLSCDVYHYHVHHHHQYHRHNSNNNHHHYPNYHHYHRYHLCRHYHHCHSRFS